MDGIDPGNGNTALRGDPRVVAIVGAGFCGTALTIQLLRRAADTPLRIVLIDPRATPGAGVAYAARDYPYPLNVAAGHMSLDGASPADFLEFARAQGVGAASGDYLPRQLYGEYLQQRFTASQRNASDCIQRRARAFDLRRGSTRRWELLLDDGGMLAADEVVLALGNPSPALPPELAEVAATNCYMPDPWSIGAGPHSEIESVLLLGSGLTMIDAALRLAAVRPRVRHIHVLSRHGLLPLPQATDVRRSLNPDVAAALDAAAGSARRSLRALRELASATLDANGDWREILALARAHTHKTWHQFNVTERARFLRHARAYWEIHRHRVPAGPLNAVHTLRRLGTLEIHAGRLLDARRVDDVVEVRWRPRGGGRTKAWIVDRIVNCTGPDHCVTRSTDPLVRSLLAKGFLRSDPCGLGIEVANDGRVLCEAGTPVDGLSYLGPWLRARDWEATAVPELREHAAALARRLSQTTAEDARTAAA